ncbi:MAG: hypothetical protein ACM3XR_04655, partial [Bacillota bacterium]
PGGVAFVCGNYLRNGRNACSSHFVHERPIIENICEEMATIFNKGECFQDGEVFRSFSAGNEFYEKRLGEIRRQIELNRRRQEMIYRDRLDGIISRQLFDRMNEECEIRIKHLENEIKSLEMNPPAPTDVQSLVGEAASVFINRRLTPELARLVVKRITVYEENEKPRDDTAGRTDRSEMPGSIVIDFRF